MGWEGWTLFLFKGLGLSIPGCRDTEAALFEVQAYVRCRDAKPYAPGLGLSRTFWCSFVAMMAGVKKRRPKDRLGVGGW